MFNVRVSVWQQLCVQNIKNPTFLKRICWSWNLNPSPERHWEMLNLICYPPPKCLLSCSVQLCVFVCGCWVWWEGFLSATAVMRWHADLSLSAALNPWPPHSKMSVPPNQPTNQSQLLAHITPHLSQSLPMIAIIWHYVFCDPPKPLSWHSGPPALLLLHVWLCSQQPHLLWVNTTLGTISPVLAKLLLTLLNWVLIACQQDVADIVALTESLTQPS